MNPGRLISIGLVSGMVIAAAFLAFDRNGLLAWVGVALGALLLLKLLRWPSSRDTLLCVVAVGAWTLSWGAAWAYVVSTWESGEVVELEVASEHTARVWVLDLSEGPLMYYDAPPDVAGRLLAGAPVSMTRGAQVRDGCAHATRVQEVPEERLRDLTRQLESKYEGLHTATTVFYVVLGGKRDRVGVLVELTACE